MSTVQKIIKALAIALAVFIIFSIVSAISGVLIGVAGINFAFDWISDNSSENFITVEDKFNIEEIENIELNSSVEDIEILQGEEFKVVAQNVPDSYTCELNENTLVINSRNDKNKFKIKKDSSVKVYVPDEFKFKKGILKLGVGETRIESLMTDVLDIECGAGEVNIQYIEANERADINCGVGEFNIENSKLSNVDFSSGVGEVNITSEFKGKSSIEAGVGEVNINLKKFDEDFGKITISKGIGELCVNGKDYSGNQTFGNGNDMTLEIEGGIGEIDINY